MDIPLRRLATVLFLALTFTVSAQTVRERLKDPTFHAYAVIFGLTVDASSKILTFHVSQVTDQSMSSDFGNTFVHLRRAAMVGTVFAVVVG